MQGERPRPSAQQGSARGCDLFRFHVEVTREPGRLVVVPVGELDIATSDALERRIACLLVEGVYVVVDLSSLWFIDVAGMRTVSRCVQLARRHGVRFSVALGSPRIRRLFELCGVLDEFAPVYDSLAAVPV